jgi:hypothetical protein
MGRKPIPLIVKACRELPAEVWEQLDWVMEDDKIEKIEDLTLDYVIKEVKWTCERMKMDMEDYWEDDPEYKHAKQQLAKCQRWLRKWGKYASAQ